MVNGGSVARDFEVLSGHVSGGAFQKAYDCARKINNSLTVNEEYRNLFFVMPRYMAGTENGRLFFFWKFPEWE